MSKTKNSPKSSATELVTISHPEKILFPQSNITKQEVIDYYTKIAPFMIPIVQNHLIVMHRFPQGISKEGFYHKQIPDYFPSWIPRKTIQLKKGVPQTLVIINSQDSLTYLANQDVLVFHTWLSPISSIEKPDRIVFDLDPAQHDIQTMHSVLKKLKKMIEQHGLTPFLMTTGSRGYHVVIPIIAQHSFLKVHDFAKKLATQFAEKYPDQLTIQLNIKARGGKIFVDYLRNSYGQTSVACYSLRALPKAPVATPLDWNELSKSTPQKYTIKNIFKRLSRKKNIWKNFKTSAKKLKI